MNIKQILENHSLWLKGDGGERADLSGAGLSGANLRYANLRHAVMSHADLRHADLRHADLRHADLRHADLRHAVMSHADLRHAVMSHADLYDADLRHADLRGADLRGAVLRRCVGNMEQIKSMQIDSWSITYTSEVMQIGCQRHQIREWFAFDDNKISSMDKNALEWWRKYKPLIQLAIELSPAVPTGVES